MKFYFGAVVALLSGAVPYCTAQAAPRPDVFRKLVDCRAIPDAQQRLACYDANVAALGDAEKKNDVVVVDRAEVRKARKTLFGLTLPDLGLFGGGKGNKTEEVQEIESTLARAAPGPDGKYIFVLEDGARWQQIEPHSFSVDPRAGMKIRIRKAAMASFLANVGGQTAVRVARVQ